MYHEVLGAMVFAIAISPQRLRICAWRADHYACSGGLARKGQAHGWKLPLLVLASARA